MMYSVLISVACFIVAVVVHVVIHRLTRSVVAAIGAYTAGLVLLLSVTRETLYPVTGVFLYCFLVVGYLLYFLSYLNDAESPSAKVLEIVRSRGPVSEDQIVSRFTNEELIGMRLTRLIRSGWLVGSKRRVRVTRKGVAIAGFFAWYRRLLRWDEGG